MKTSSSRDVVKMVIWALLAACALLLVACSGSAEEPFGATEAAAAGSSEPAAPNEDAGAAPAEEEDDVDAATETIERRMCPQFVLCVRGARWNKHLCRCVRIKPLADAGETKEEASADAGCH